MQNIDREKKALKELIRELEDKKIELKANQKNRGFSENQGYDFCVKNSMMESFNRHEILEIDQKIQKARKRLDELESIRQMGEE